VYVSYAIQVVTEEENKKRKKDRARPSCAYSGRRHRHGVWSSENTPRRDQLVV